VTKKVTRSEIIRLKNLERVFAKYSYLNRDFLIGFDHGQSAVLKRIGGEADFDIPEMKLQ